jgi:hypothetical protein
MRIFKSLLLAVVGLVVQTQTVKAHYDPNIGRWISRDPIAEVGGVNLYGFLENHVPDRFDYLGLNIVAPPKGTVPDEKDCVSMTLGEFWVNEQKWGAKPTEADMTTSAAGCVGVCRASQGNQGNNNPSGMPEDQPNTTCYLEEAKARERFSNCPKGSTPLLWNKQGTWKNDKAPVPAADGSVPNDSIVGIGAPGAFNYETQLGDYYVYVNHQATKDANGIIMWDSATVYICKKHKNVKKEIIWCTSCCARTSTSGYDGSTSK